MRTTQPLEIQKRRSLSPQEKSRVIARQSGRCACGCGELLEPGQIDFDHDKPLWAGGSNDLSNFNALVRKHHKVKSNTNNSRRAKADRVRAKHEGRWLNAQERELARIMSRTKQL